MQRCDHCETKTDLLHESIFTDQISPNEHLLYRGKHKRFARLCNNCWDELISVVEKYLKEKKNG